MRLRFLHFLLPLIACTVMGAADVRASELNGKAFAIADLYVPASTLSDAEALWRKAARFEPALPAHHADGRQLVYGFKADNLIQAAIASAGLAAWYPSGDAARYSEMILKAEQSARSEKIGLWQDVAIDTAANKLTAADCGHFRVVTGTVTETYRGKTVAYLNFGESWRTDFTIRMTPAVLRALERSGSVLDTLKGKTVEIRGYAHCRNGVMIDLVRLPALRLLD